jgi:hypothetical protein
MENELLRNQLQSTRNILQTLAGNIDNTILAYNEMNRSNYRSRTTAARRNLNNLYQELRNMYPTNLNRTNTNTTSNLNNTNTTTNLNSTNLNSTNLNSNLDSYRRRNIDSTYPLNDTNINRTSTPLTSTLNTTLNSIINNRINNSTEQPDMIEVTLYNNGTTTSNMEDVPVYPSLRTLSRASDVYMYQNLNTEYESCTICRERFSPNSIVRKLQCGHIFHIGCIDTWFENNISCPVCRSDLRDQRRTESDDEDENNNSNISRGVDV